MAFFKKSSFGNVHLTDADRKRIADIDNSPAMENRKCKYQMTLKHPGIKAEICISVYGKDTEMIKSNIAEYLKFFRAADKRWELIKTEDMKKKDDEEEMT